MTDEPKFSGERKFTDLAHRDEAGNLHCPKCNGTQFEAVRSTGRKILFGVASLLAPANEVRCITCGAKFKRG